jgi:heme a synthase
MRLRQGPWSQQSGGRAAGAAPPARPTMDGMGTGTVAGARRLRISEARRLTVSPLAFERIAWVAVWVLVVTIVSGAAVRLTGSGLGCPDWPNCTATHVVAPWQFHAWVEFGNRLINAAVSIAAIGALGAALRRRPRRRDLTWLSTGLMVGLFAEVALGAVLVKEKLAPALVSAHFLLGLVFLADAVVLHHRAGIPDSIERTKRVALVDRPTVAMSRLMLIGTAVVAALGTVVTSTGPHGGDPSAPRFRFSLHAVAQVHGTAVEAFLLITVVALWNLARTGAPRLVIRRAQVLLGALALQGAVGYAQYLNGDPVALVAIHVAGASIVVLAVLRYYLSLWARAEPSPADGVDRPETEVALAPAGASALAPGT